ncbi:MAG: 23S rRNA (guanosine(2251)-2'-O)-methyltransferase RlmB [Pseudomonadota bacterium]
MSQRTIIHGFHAIQSRLRHHPQSIQIIYLDVSRRDKRAQDLRQLAEAKGVKLVASEASRLDEMAHGKSQGVVAFVEPVQLARTLTEVIEDLTEPALLLVLDGVTDPHNLGACLRSADAFGAHAVIVPRDRSASLNAAAIKAASGAADTVPLIPVTNLARSLRELKEHNILLVGTDQDGPLAVAEADFSGPAALVLGAEGTGMRRLTREHCDVLVRIPMFGQVESLNVSVSAGVCLYEARRQRMRIES